VHAIIDDSARHLLSELAERVRASVADRPIHLILENENNQASRLARDPDNQPRCYTAQWNDDVHHALHTAATGEAQGYYAEYQGETCRLGRALAEGFAFQGETMAYSGRARGEPSADLPPDAFVAFMQNHDQIGNRAFGDRIGGTASLAALRAVSAIYLLLPQVPMLFMGEEFAASQPFPFFCDFSGDLGKAVVEGRRREFASFPEFRDPEMRERIPDPQAQTTFAAAKLAWDDMHDPSRADWLEWYRRVLAVRRDAIVPLIPGVSRGAAKYECVGDSAVAISWRIGRRGELCLAANLSAVPVSGFPIDPGRRVLWQEGQVGEDGALAAWSVLWTLAATPA
jgi:malto-oligosyltrehalose trehalohydrolase